MTRRDPHAEGDGPLQLITAALWLFLAFAFLFAFVPLVLAVVEFLLSLWFGPVDMCCNGGA